VPNFKRFATDFDVIKVFVASFVEVFAVVARVAADNLVTKLLGLSRDCLPNCCWYIMRPSSSESYPNYSSAKRSSRSSSSSSLTSSSVLNSYCYLLLKISYIFKFDLLALWLLVRCLRQNELVVCPLVNDLSALHGCELVVVTVNDELSNFKSFEAVVVALNDQTVKFAACASVLYVDVIVVTVDG